MRIAYFQAAAVVHGYGGLIDFGKRLVAVDEPSVMVAEVAGRVAGHLVDEPRVEERQRQDLLKDDARAKSEVQGWRGIAKGYWPFSEFGSAKIANSASKLSWDLTTGDNTEM